MFSLNGLTPPQPERGLRWIWFGGSIISDWNNPIATTNRAVIRSLQHRGQQVMFVEPSDHPAFRNALSARGSAIYRAFQERYPDIHYRRETLPGGSEGDVWLSRETALADVLIVQDDAPAQIVEWLARVPASPIVRIFLSRSESAEVDPNLFDRILSPAHHDLTQSYDPAVLRPEHGGGPRSGSLSVVYGGGPETGTNLVAAGASASKHVPFIAEARLERRYQEVERVVIYDDDASPFAAARAMLAAAAGAVVMLSRPGSAPQRIETWNDADSQAARLIEQVMSIRARRHAVQE